MTKSPADFVAQATYSNDIIYKLQFDYLLIINTYFQFTYLKIETFQQSGETPTVHGSHNNIIKMEKESTTTLSLQGKRVRTR